MNEEDMERMYVWLVSKRVKGSRYRKAIHEEHHVDREISKPTSPEARRLVARLVEELRIR